MALEDYKKSVVKSGIMWVGKTDFDKGRKLHASVYYYKKGWFSGHENKHVIKVYDAHDQIGGDKIEAFDTKSEAMSYANKFMREN